MMKEEKREGKERGRFSGFANWEKFPGYAIAKKSMYFFYKKLQSLDPLHERLLSPRSLRPFKF